MTTYPTHPIAFPDEGVTTDTDVEPLGGGTYRLRSVPVLVESAAFMDVIEADAAADGTLTFRRVVTPAGWRVVDLLVSREAIDGGKLDGVLAKAEQLGGHWERVFGGVVYVCLPPGVAWDPAADLWDNQIPL